MKSDTPGANVKQTQLRRVMAILNYLAQDRYDISYAVKEVLRRSSCPNDEDLKRTHTLVHQLKRLGAPCWAAARGGKGPSLHLKQMHHFMKTGSL